MDSTALQGLHGLLIDGAGLAGPLDPLIGAVAVRDDDLPRLGEPGLPVAVVVTGGAGQLAGPARLCARRGLTVASVTVALRDLDDLAGNARRVVTAVDDARADGSLAEDATVRVALPAEPAGHGWLAAADEIAAAELEAALTLTGHGVRAPEDAVAGWLDALLDRETGFAALGADHARDVLAVLSATAAAWDGASPDEVAAALASDTPDPAGWATGRRWCRAVEVADGAAVAEQIRRWDPAGR